MQEFYIKQGSTLPYLRMELIHDGRFDYHKSMLFNNAIQSAEVTFSMIDNETGLLRVSKAPVEVVLADNNNCEENYILQYKWKEKDTKKIGVFKGYFDIKFSDDLTENGIEYPKGILKMPIREDLIIFIS